MKKLLYRLTMGFAGSDAFASLSFPFSLRRGPPPKFGGANDKLDRLFYDSIARRRHLSGRSGTTGPAVF